MSIKKQTIRSISLLFQKYDVCYCYKKQILTWCLFLDVGVTDVFTSSFGGYEQT